jgi:hypothetical protein
MRTATQFSIFDRSSRRASASIRRDRRRSLAAAEQLESRLNFAAVLVDLAAPRPESSTTGHPAYEQFPVPAGAMLVDVSDSGRYVAFTQPHVEGADNCLRAYRLDRDVDANGIFDEPGTSSVIDVSAT